MHPYIPPTKNRIGKIKMDFNENAFGCSPKVIGALKKINIDDLSVYPAYSNFIKKLSSYLGVENCQIILTNGGEEAINTIFNTYLEKNDQIIIPTPTFALFKIYADAIGLNVKQINYKKTNKGFIFPLKNVLNAICKKTKLIVIVNPNNPTGTYIEQKNIIKIIKKARQNNSIVLIDEAYWQFCGKTSKELINIYDNIFVIQTFSKAFGLAGLRLGYIISDKYNIKNIAKAISPYSVNNLAVIAASAALDDIEFVNKSIKQVNKNKKILTNELKKLKIKTYCSSANFLIADFGFNCTRVFGQLKNKNILLRNVSAAPILKNCLRITIGTQKQTKILIKELKKILNPQAIIFDMDGVLIDVSQSYHLAIKKTIEYFGKKISFRQIQKYKQMGGTNDDYDLLEKYLFNKGFKIEKTKIIDIFDKLFIKNNLIDNEKLLIGKNLLAKLKQKYKLAIFTGRPKKDVDCTLKKFDLLDLFDFVVSKEDVLGKLKPNPFGLKLAIEKLKTDSCVYIGDNIDDCICGKKAGIETIAVIDKKITNYNDFKSKIENFGVSLIIENINNIKDVLK